MFWILLAHQPHMVWKTVRHRTISHTMTRPASGCCGALEVTY